MIRLLLILLALVCVSLPASAQVAGATCPTNGATASPDVNGNALRCLSNVWTVVSSSGGSPAGTSGAVQFTDGTAFTADAANLFWNVSTKRLGIGTDSPSTGLSIEGNFVFDTPPAITLENNLLSGQKYEIGSGEDGKFYIGIPDASLLILAFDQNGNVGIGTSTPSSLLHVFGGEAQVGSSGAACSSTTAGAIRYASAALSFCNGTSWATVSTGGGSPAGTSGAVQFTDGAAFTADAANLFWDNTTKRLGIGTTNPQSLLHLNGGNLLLSNNQNIAWNNASGTQIGALQVDSSNNLYLGSTLLTGAIGFYNNGSERMRILANGNVGIGTSSPSVRLQVVGPAVTEASTTYFSSATFINPLSLGSQRTVEIGGYQYNSYIQGWDTGTVFSSLLINPRGGNVGIGTTAPSSLFHVFGGEAQVGSSGAACSSTTAGAIRYASAALSFCNGTAWTAVSTGGGGGGSPGGSNTHVQFNNSGAFAGSANLVWENTNGRLGIGTTTPGAALDVTGTIISRANNAGSSTAIDWSQGNTQYTSASCGSYSFTNMQDGGSYVLAVLGSTAATCSFAQAGLTFKLPTGFGTTTANRQTLFYFLRVGSNVYVNWNAYQ